MSFLDFESLRYYPWNLEDEAIGLTDGFKVLEGEMGVVYIAAIVGIMGYDESGICLILSFIFISQIKSKEKKCDLCITELGLATRVLVL